MIPNNISYLTCLRRLETVTWCQKSFKASLKLEEWSKQVMATHSQIVAIPPAINEEMTRREWRNWMQQWMDYAIIAKLDKEYSKYVAAIFRGCLRPAGWEIFNGLPFDDEDSRDDVKIALKLMEGYFIGKVCITYERFKFLSRDQSEDETSTA